MLTLEQVKSLEAKVERAVQVINSLRMENKQLRASLQSANRRVAELEGSLQKVEQEQGRIEEGFKGALRKLDELEDLLSSGTVNEVEADRKMAAPVQQVNHSSGQPANPGATAEARDDFPEPVSPEESSDDSDQLF